MHKNVGYWPISYLADVEESYTVLHSGHMVKLWGLGHMNTETAGSNPTRGNDVCLTYDLISWKFSSRTRFPGAVVLLRRDLQMITTSLCDVKKCFI
jgi:hypothetical protein